MIKQCWAKIDNWFNDYAEASTRLKPRRIDSATLSAMFMVFLSVFFLVVIYVGTSLARLVN